MLCLSLGDGCQAVLDGQSVVGSPIQPRREAETQAIRTRSCSVSDTFIEGNGQLLDWHIFYGSTAFLLRQECVAPCECADLSDPSGFQST